MQVKDEIQKLIAETAERLGYQVYESGILMKGENSKIAVKLDSRDGISHSDCERFSKELSAGIDVRDLLPNYSLEISSPGLNRAVRGRNDFIRFAGSPVKIVYREGDDRKVVKGVIGALSDASSLSSAVLLVPAAFLVGGAIWTWGAFTGRRG